MDAIELALAIEVFLNDEKLSKGLRGIAENIADSQTSLNEVTDTLLVQIKEFIVEQAVIGDIVNGLDDASRALGKELEFRRLMNMSADDLVDTQLEILNGLKKIRDTEKLRNGLAAEHKIILGNVAQRMMKFNKNLRESNDLAGKLAKGLDAMGMKGVGKLVVAFGSLKGAILLVVGVLKEYLELEFAVSKAQLRIYGSVRDTTKSVNAMSAEYGILRKTAVSASEALAKANVALSPDDLKKFGGEMGMISEATGFSAESMAQFSKVMLVTGSSVEQTMNSLANFSYVATQFGLDATESAAMMRKVRDEALALEAAFGARGVQEYSSTMAALSQQAKKFGGSIESVTGALDTSMETAIAYTIALGSNRLFKSASSNALELRKNIGDVAERYEMWFTGKFAQYPEKLTELLNGNKDVATAARRHHTEWEQFMAEKGNTQEKWIAMVLEDEKKETAAVDLAKKQRESAMAAWQAFSESAKAAGIQILAALAPVLKVLQWLAEGFIWLQQKTDGWFGKIIIGGGASIFVLLKIKKIFGGLLGLFSKLGKQVTGLFMKSAPGQAKSLSATLKGLGEGLKNFFNQMAETSIVGMLKTGLAILILGGAMLGLGYIAAQFDTNMLDAVIGLVTVAAVMFLISKMSGKIDVAGLMQFAFAALMLGLAVLAIGGAVMLSGGAEKLIHGTLAVVIVAIALVASMLVLGWISKILVTALPGLMILAIAAGLLGLAILAVGLAMKVADDPGKMIATAWAMVLVVGALAIVGATMLFAGPALLIGSVFMIVGVFMLNKVMSMINEITSTADPSKLIALGEALRSFANNVSGVGIRFMLSSWFMASGLGSIGKAVAKYMPTIQKNVGGLEALVQFMETIQSTPVSQLEEFADGFADALRTMANAADKYGGRISRALMPLGDFSKMMATPKAQETMAAGGEETAPTTEITKQPKTIWEQIFGSDKEDENISELKKLNTKMDSIIGVIGGNVTPAILKELQTYLPEIADDIVNKPSTSWK